MERVKSAGRGHISAVKEKKKGIGPRSGKRRRIRIYFARASAFFSHSPFSREKYATKRDIDPFVSSVYWSLLHTRDALIGLPQHIFFANTAFPLLQENQYRLCKKKKKRHPCSEENVERSKYSDLMARSKPFTRLSWHVI